MALRGHLTEKADIFSFGVVALEIISGRSNSDSSWKTIGYIFLTGQVELIDPTLNLYDDDAINEATRIIGVALLCTQGTPSLRPAMSRVVAMICGDIEVASVTTRPSYLTDWTFNDTTGTTMSTSNVDISPANLTTTTTSTSMTNRSPSNDAAKPMLNES
ncbi:probable LRR receptor-like serine/threonine-protein kinase at1g56140 [Phtheirospermum japonicum]|uniref:Probable LRR receptor-like serine/threonine-protein kinase at1g56140 n=1 Tax=Phtheirospermum japonicum TaxID=374723 RepID=A0A830CM54_9LAMI|nr:probable LRR receptor-like serine/threonine-protein kinase at1g56140 [Phtheirospermum japonicum]